MCICDGYQMSWSVQLNPIQGLGITMNYILISFQTFQTKNFMYIQSGYNYLQQHPSCSSLSKNLQAILLKLKPENLHGFMMF